MDPHIAAPGQHLDRLAWLADGEHRFVQRVELILQRRDISFAVEAAAIAKRQVDLPELVAVTCLAEQLTRAARPALHSCEEAVAIMGDLVERGVDAIKIKRLGRGHQPAGEGRDDIRIMAADRT